MNINYIEISHTLIYETYTTSSDNVVKLGPRNRLILTQLICQS